MPGDLYGASDKDRIAVMANRIGPGIERHRDIVGMCGDQIERERGDAIAETPVCFLQGDDIRTHFVQHVEDTLRPTQPVRSDAFTNVIAGDFQHSLAE